jgi:23S rRNA (cytidine1920-2'-O)/16S rRNA (cytidine1409-2'-O)-methyltransferase
VKRKERLDKLLLERGIVATAELAQSLILRGDVLVNDCPVTKAGQATLCDSDIRLRGEVSKYVSRGGDKLDGALEEFSLEVEGLVAIDVGASTGGFTDCLLQYGAKHVYAIDVGKAQLSEKLRQDSRVTSKEELHAKDLRREMFDPPPTLAVIDVSFIGLTRVLPHVVSVLVEPWIVLALVKPQFELGPEYVEVGGVVTDEATQKLAVSEVVSFAERNGWVCKASAPSKVKGAKKGNQEYFVLLEPG